MQLSMQIYFAVVGLDLLGALDEVDRDSVISYIYSLQIASGSGRSAGFIGSGYMGFSFCEHCACSGSGGSGGSGAGGSEGIPCAYTALYEEEPASKAIAMLEVGTSRTLCVCV
jgi:hypothetical protein